MNLLRLLAYTRIPGNILSFWLRRTIRWSRGTPRLINEPKEQLFSYLSEDQFKAERRAEELNRQFHLAPLEKHSPASLYRQNLYQLDLLELATQGLDICPKHKNVIKAVDVGSQDWRYVFALERWLRFRCGNGTQQVYLDGVELDGYEILADLYSRFDYATLYANQTGNPHLHYLVTDFLMYQKAEQDVVFIFYPIVLRYQILLWGLPLSCFTPDTLLAHAAQLTHPGGWIIIFCHTILEHEAVLTLAASNSNLRLAREGKAESNLLDFQDEANDTRFSIWQRIESVG